MGEVRGGMEPGKPEVGTAAGEPMGEGIADWGREQAATLERGLEARCRDLMKRDVASIAPDATIEVAAQLMVERNVGFLPVCDADGRAIGTVTDRDIAIRAVAAGKAPSECMVREVMTEEVIACRADDDVNEAERLMAEHQVARVCITDGEGRIEGVISLSDIAQHESFERATQLMREIVSREAH